MGVPIEHSAEEIGAQLGIYPYTVNDRSKALFQKAGVRSQQQLVAALFFDHYLPRRQKNSVPGPYGWFLEDEPGEKLARQAVQRA